MKKKNYAQRKEMIKRYFCFFLLLTLLNQVLFPTVMVGLTSYNTQPEVTGYQPVDATDNVSLTSGKFNYTIPITSIPEYPMAIGYSSGMGMDQEAGVFGYGFNGFSGAISRTMMGLPDDVKGGSKTYTFQNDKWWDVSAGATVGVSIGASLGNFAAVGVSASSTSTHGYNSYTGMYGVFSQQIGAGASLFSGKFKVFPSANVGIYAVDDSRADNITFGASASVGLSSSIHLPNFTGASAWATTSGSSGKWKTGSYVVGAVGKSVFANPSSGTTSFLSPLCYVIPVTSGFGTSLSVPVYQGPPFVTINASYAQNDFKWGGKLQIKQKNVYGFGYLNYYDRSDRGNMADLTVEGEDSHNPAAYNNPSYLQHDLFSASAMGLNGGFRLFQKDYGVVSRNYTRKQYRDIQLLIVATKTNRSEVYPWTDVSQSVLNQSVDIIALFKKKSNNEDKADFDNVLFREDVVENLNDSKRRFKDVEFKMRGDLAGENDLGSNSFTDHSPDQYNLLNVPYSGGHKLHLFGFETTMPLYSPHVSSQDDYSNNQKNIERGTVITKWTIDELLSMGAANGFVCADPNGAHASNTNPADPFFFKQSYFTHYNYTGLPTPTQGPPGICPTCPPATTPPTTSIPKASPAVLNSNVTPFNILAHIKNDIVAPVGTFNACFTDPHHVRDTYGAIAIENTNGLKYYFTLPAFQKKTSAVQLQGMGALPPVGAGSNYDSGSGNNRNKLTTEDQYYYPYAWMLTAIVGDDYIDFDNVPGPSDGDIGYWVKFRYVKTSDNYRWRAPFMGMTHLPNSLQAEGDDAYTTNSGEKEIYCLAEIESANYLCRYKYEKRFDGYDAAGFVNGDAFNSLTSAFDKAGAGDLTGDNCQFAVTSINLFKKHSDGDNSSPITPTTLKPIKSTNFYYNYTTCPNVPNNLINNGYTIPKSSVPYYVDNNGNPPNGQGNIESGKLTLRKVQHVAYDDQGNPVNLPSYQFTYFSDVNSKYNPSYDPEAIDQWGNYSSGSSDRNGTNWLVDPSNHATFYHKYTEYIKPIADDNSKVFNLKEILLPSGGTMQVDYEAQSYGFVEDKTPYVMRHVMHLDHDLNSGTSTAYVDITDLHNASSGPLDLTTATVTNASGQEDKLVKVGDQVYGEITFFKHNTQTNTNNRGNTTAPDEAGVQAGSSGSLVTIPMDVTVVGFGNVSGPDNHGRYTQQVILQNPSNVTPPPYSPYYSECQNYMYLNSNEMRAVKHSFGTCGDISSISNDLDNLQQEDIVDATRDMAANFRNFLSKWVGVPPTTTYDGCFGVPGSYIFPHLSFLRTKIYKAKYTGSSVKSIKVTDGFNYATDPGGSNNPVQSENSYGTNYFYDLAGDGSATSAGVTAVEPGGGEANVINLYDRKGSGFTSGPNIISSRTSVSNDYAASQTSSSAAGSIVSREKGKTTYDFYTSKDPGLHFNDNFNEGGVTNAPGNPYGSFDMFGMFTFLMIKFNILGKTIKIKLGPIYVPIIIHWKKHDQYYVKSYSYTDMSDMFGRPKSTTQYDAGGTQLGVQNFEYYGKDEPVNVYKTFALSSSNKKPGKMDQVWSEAYYEKNTDIERVLLLLNAKTHRNFCYTNMKYSYIPPVLKKVTSTFDGLTTTTINEGFDYYSGSPVQTRSSDSYGNDKIIKTYPAYWYNADMGPRDVLATQNNNLTATEVTEMYLNQVNQQHVLGAGAVEYAPQITSSGVIKWNMISYYKPDREYVSATDYKYSYSPVTAVPSLYTSGFRLADKTNNKLIQRNASIYKAYKGYTYEIPLNTNGTFTSYSSFNPNTNYAPGAPWKLLSTNTLYSPNGVLVESQDVLGKYASQLLGYNYSNTIGAVSNASWAGAAHEGAENTYKSSSGFVLLECNKVKIKDASQFKPCTKTFNTLGLAYNTLPLSGTSRVADKLSIQVPTNVTYGVPFAKLDISFTCNPTLVRSFYISMDINHHFEMISNLGEYFDGYWVFTGTTNHYDLYFDPAIFNSISLDNTFTPSGYTVSFATNQVVLDCFASLKYTVPCNDCGGEVHTGEYAFKLYPGKIGTEFDMTTNYSKSISLSVPKMDPLDFKRKFKAMVWVHNSSPLATQLVVDVFASGGSLLSTQSTSTPYVVAGNWRLLRVDFDLSATSGDQVSVYVKNPSSGGIAVYDDYRVLPFNGEMTNWVFNHKFNRVTSGLDNDNFASFSRYDARGRSVESAVELQNAGKTTVQKFLYNDQKNN